MTAAPLLEVRDLRVELGGRPALDGVSFSLSAGACLGLVGESGSGKTMTCRALTGLLGRIGGRVAGGSARFGELDLLTLPESGWARLRGREVALVPQASLSSLDPVMRIGRQLEETVRAVDPGVDARARALELLELVHMPRAQELLRRYPHELSGGMRQRVMIALGIAGRPRVLFADEPTTALDASVRRGILALLAELRREHGMALVLISHDLATVREVADEIAIMYAGTVAETGAAAAVLAHPTHPYTRALLAADAGRARKGVPLEAIPGAPPGLGERPAGCPFAPRCPRALERCGEQPPLVPVAADHLSACWNDGRAA